MAQAIGRPGGLNIEGRRVPARRADAAVLPNSAPGSDMGDTSAGQRRRGIADRRTGTSPIVIRAWAAGARQGSSLSPASYSAYQSGGDCAAKSASEAAAWSRQSASGSGGSAAWYSQSAFASGGSAAWYSQSEFASTGSDASMGKPASVSAGPRPACDRTTTQPGISALQGPPAPSPPTSLAERVSRAGVRLA